MSSVKLITVLVTLLSIIGSSVLSPAPIQGCRFMCGPQCNQPTGTIMCCVSCDHPKFQIENDIPDAAKIEDQEQDSSALVPAPGPAVALEGLELEEEGGKRKSVESPVKESTGAGFVSNCSGVRRITCHYQCALALKECNISTCKCYDN